MLSRLGFVQNLFKSDSGSLLGLDISTSSVKLVELSRSGDGYRLDACASEPLPPGAVNEKQIADPDAVGKAIQRAVARSGSGTRNAAVAVAGSSVITKIINLPSSLSDDEMEEQIKIEADQYIPYPIDEVNLDFQVLRALPNAPDTAEVLLAVCRRDTVEARAAALETAGLKPKVVDIEAHALQNACTLLEHQMPDGGKDKTIALIDIGSTGTGVHILHDRELVYSREQPFGGKQLTDEIARHYGMSFDEAEKAKRSGGLPQDYETTVLAQFLDDVAVQIERSLQFFFASMPRFSSIDQILLAGGSAGIAGIDQTVARKLNIPSVVARPFEQMRTGWRIKRAQLEQDAPGMLIAAGLALRAFD
ncbi:MAG TPA: pilus assembly protein PilM [Nevskiales bacterium]|nr:pilus assembly protein PilM [Nevskiales bacterium]